MATIYQFPTPENARRLARKRKLELDGESPIDVVKSGRLERLLELWSKYYRDVNTTYKKD